MQKGQSSSPSPVRCAGEDTPSTRLSDTPSATHSGQLGINTQNLELSLYHSCLHLFTNAYIHKHDLIKTMSSTAR